MLKSEMLSVFITIFAFKKECFVPNILRYNEQERIS